MTPNGTNHDILVLVCRPRFEVIPNVVPVAASFGHSVPRVVDLRTRIQRLGQQRDVVPCCFPKLFESHVLRTSCATATWSCFFMLGFKFGKHFLKSRARMAKHGVGIRCQLQATSVWSHSFRVT